MISKTQRGSFAQQWWGKKWIEALERLIDAGRLRRGKKYARKGQVMRITEEQGRITAQVQGVRETPYEVTLALDHLTDEQWVAVIDAMSRQVILAAELLAGVMPEDIESAFQEAGVHLFPVQAQAIHATCSCPDWADVCKHIAATHFLLAERFDEDPFMLFRLRGRNQQEIMDALLGLQEPAFGEDSTVQGEEDDMASDLTDLDALIDVFWQGAQGKPEPANLHSPDIEMALLKQLGPPAFTGADVIKTLAPLYRALSQTGLDIVKGTYTPTKSDSSS